MDILHSRRMMCLVILLSISKGSSQKYEPNWKSLDSRPLPEWYDKAKVGIFVHWSLNSVPSFGFNGRTSCRFWLWWREGDPDTLDFVRANYPPGWTFQDFAPQFRAEFFDPDWWAKFFEDVGARYVVFVSKHHEGWTNWKSKYQWGFNSVDEGPKRDLVGDLARSIRNLTKLHFGLYSNLNALDHPLFIEDWANNFTTNNFPTKVVMPMLKELVEKYRPEIVWSDGVVKPITDKYWTSLDFLTWLYNDSPVKDFVVTNDRWGYGDLCEHGGFLTCHDRFNPLVLQKRKWESCNTIDKVSWCYNRASPENRYTSATELIATLVQVVSCGGNFLLNFGPTHDGRIMPIFQERLRAMGAWLKINGEAIYESHPWRVQNDTITGDVWYTTKTSDEGQTDVYANILSWPIGGILSLGAPTTTKNTTVQMLGYNGTIPWVPSGQSGGVNISLSVVTLDKLPNEHAWTLKFTNIH